MALIVTVGLAQPALAQTDASHGMAAFEGAPFAYVGGEAQRNALESAIDRVVAQMNVFARPFARRRLRERNPVYQTIAIQWLRGNIAVLMPGRVFVSPANGAAVDWRGPDGETYRLRQRVEGGRVIQEVAGHDGARENAFTLEPDGRTVHMRVRIQSPRLPATIEYELTYRR